MPDIVSLDLTPHGDSDHDDDPFVVARSAVGIAREPAKLTRSDFRLHGGGTPHWLVRHPLGIDMLVNQLQAVRPDMSVPRYRISPSMYSLLDGMVDVLGMRAWPEPKTMAERVRAGWLIVRCVYCQGAARPLPDWRDAASSG
ncbi:MULTISPECIES: hypothetical protein [Ramlibacter]|uniref:LysR substrate-binding domain-containing protein n=1 Tax=Ramlibacter aquaticus TaxID=2780094 RepID=A0ABR9SDK1_9BURK|nr:MULTISPECIES: hypothetical protein [Ramlibacter]MBE7940132.1 hypothetical protein [Ramlibacter aquaticus]